MSNTKKAYIKYKREWRATYKSRNNQLLKTNENKNMSFKTQALKQAAIDAQQLVVNAAVGQPAINDAKAKLSEIKSEEVE